MKKKKLTYLIDDDNVFIFCFRRLVEKMDIDAEVKYFTSAEEALRHMMPLLDSPESAPERILVDLNMPVMDGWQFLNELEKIKSEELDIDVRIMSSSIDPSDLERAKTYKVVSEFVTKPVDKKKLSSIFDVPVGSGN